MKYYCSFKDLYVSLVEYTGLRTIAENLSEKKLNSNWINVIWANHLVGIDTTDEFRLNEAAGGNFIIYSAEKLGFSVSIVYIHQWLMLFDSISLRILDNIAEVLEGYS